MTGHGLEAVDPQFRVGDTMKTLSLLVPLALVAACQSPSGLAAGQVSCQPVGVSPAPMAFSFPPGPATAASAQQTAVALVRGCASTPGNGGPGGVDGNSLTSTVEAGTGELPGPNSGRDVWLVRIDAKANDGIGESHYLVEVNKDTGVPTLVGIG